MNAPDIHQAHTNAARKFLPQLYLRKSAAEADTVEITPEDKLSLQGFLLNLPGRYKAAVNTVNMANIVTPTTPMQITKYSLAKDTIKLAVNVEAGQYDHHFSRAGLAEQLQTAKTGLKTAMSLEFKVPQDAITPRPV